MNINIFCRLRLTNSFNSSSKISIDRNKTIISRANGPFFRFKCIFKENDDINEIYKACLNPLINGVINGYNSSLLLFGESGAGKSFTLAGNDGNRNGLFAITMRDMFTKLESDERFRSRYKVHLRMFEIHDDVLVDLIKANNSSKFSPYSVSYTAEQGYEIKDMTEVDIGSAAQAAVLFRDSWSRRITYGDNDPDLQVATIVHIKLLLKNFEENDRNTISQMSFVYLPGDQNLIQPMSTISGEKKRNGIFAVGALIDDLSDPAKRNVNYGNSLLTTLLEDELGGNSITHALLCLPSSPSPDVLAAQLRTMNNLEKVKNCPIINTDSARNLLCSLRSQRKELLLGIFKDVKLTSTFSAPNEQSVLENLKLVQRENAELRDKVESLQVRLEKTNNRYSHAMMDKSNLSDDFIQSEEEKLRASKKIMDLEIENSKFREKMETVRFELSNKILYLEERLSNAELERALYLEDSKAFKAANDEKNQLSKLLFNLQKSYDDLKNETGLIVSKNKELNLEFVNMWKGKGKLSKSDVDAVAVVDMDGDRGIYRLNQDRRPLSNISSQQDKNLKIRLGKLQDELLKARQTAQERLQKISQSSVDLIVLKEENHQLNVRTKDLANTLRTISEEYRQRLQKYSLNMSTILDATETNEKQYKEEITKLLKAYDTSYTVNENQLKNVLKDTRNQYDSLRKWTERIVYEYIKVRQQIIDDGIKITDMGPDPVNLMHDYVIPNDYLKMASLSCVKRESSNLMELKQQIKEFSNATQMDLEIERAQLLARNAELEEQLISAQNYIDIYIKQKPVRPRK